MWLLMCKTAQSDLHDMLDYKSLTQPIFKLTWSINVTVVIRDPVHFIEL